MRTIEPMMPTPLSAEPQPTLPKGWTLFCAAVLLVLVTTGVLSQDEEPTAQTADCAADVLVIPASDTQHERVFACVQ